MKKIFAVIIAVAMMCGVVMAQETANLGTKAGDKSMNFTFAGLGAFGIGATGPSGGFGVSYFLGSDAAVRLGLQVRSNATTVPANPAAGQTGTDGSTSSFTFAVAGDYLMYMQGATSRVRPYWGSGVTISMNSTTAKTAVIAPVVQTETKAGAGTTITLNGIMGAEFYLYPELSLSAEYTLTLFSLNAPADNVVTQGATSTTTKQVSSAQILGFGQAGATLHIYF